MLYWINRVVISNNTNGGKFQWNSLVSNEKWPGWWKVVEWFGWMLMRITDCLPEKKVARQHPALDGAPT